MLRRVPGKSAETQKGRVLLTLISLLALVAVPLFGASQAAAEEAWVRGGLRINLRSDAGTKYRIIGVLETGNAVDVLERREEWIKVRPEDGEVGWIPKGYLEAERPPYLRLQRAEDEVASLRAHLEESEAAVAHLTAENGELGSRDNTQRESIEELKTETAELRASRRWPEWITGASVLAAGMLLGAILHRSSQRRPQARIRL